MFGEKAPRKARPKYVRKEDGNGKRCYNSNPKALRSEAGTGRFAGFRSRISNKIKLLLNMNEFQHKAKYRPKQKLPVLRGLLWECLPELWDATLLYTFWLWAMSFPQKLSNEFYDGFLWSRILPTWQNLIHSIEKKSYLFWIPGKSSQKYRNVFN